MHNHMKFTFVLLYAKTVPHIYIYIYIYIYIKPLKSEAIHETGLSGNVVTSFFPLIIFIYIYIYMYICIYSLLRVSFSVSELIFPLI